MNAKQGIDEKGGRYSAFGLTLMVNHACNLRCAYCYTGRKVNRPMPLDIGAKAIDRAVESVERGGTLELGFFGGEPLLEAERIDWWIEIARRSCIDAGVRLALGMTTNGTIADQAAWALMIRPEMDLAISCDGRPETHDRNRVFANGDGSSARVADTMRRLRDAEKEFRAVMVVRPNTVDELTGNLDFLRGAGVKMVDLSLDLWTEWTPGDALRLSNSLGEAAAYWRAHLPEFGVNWFNGKLVRAAGIQELNETARCGFGAGEIAVAPSGNLYPCERLIGEDVADSSTRLAGHTLAGGDFLDYSPFAGRSASPCSNCSIQTQCGTACRCSNYVRSGDVSRPDGLLCLLDKVCHRETLRAFADKPQLAHENN